MENTDWNAFWTGVNVVIYGELFLAAFWMLFRLRAKAKTERTNAAPVRAQVARIGAGSSGEIVSLARRVEALERRLDSHVDHRISRHAG